MKINNTIDIDSLTISPDRLLHSATHQEILDGLTTDIYFVRARDILAKLGLLETPVTADIFARRSGLPQNDNQPAGRWRYPR